MKRKTTIKTLAARTAMTFILVLLTTMARATDVTVTVDNWNDLLVQLTETGAEAPAVVQLTADVTNSVSDNLIIPEGRTVTLDLNGHTLNMSNKTLATYGNLTVRDLSSSGNGSITGNGRFVVQVGGSSKNGSMTLQSGKITGTQYGIYVYKNLTINGGEVSAGSYTIYDQGSFVLNAGTITGSSATTVQVKGGSFTMNGGTVVTTGTGQAINLHSDCSATIYDGTILAQNGEGNSGAVGITAYKNTELTMHGGTITAYKMALAGNGSDSGNNEGTNAKFTITGGTLTSTHEQAIHAPQVLGEVTIEGGTITGARSGIELRAGTLNISGGTITGNTQSFDASDAAKGYGVIGSAVAVVQHTSKQPIDVNISGGTLNGYLPLSEYNALGNPEEDLHKINYNISGGLFHSTGTEAISIADYLNGPFVTGGRFTYSVAQYVASRYTESQDSETDPYFVSPICSVLADGTAYTLTDDLDAFSATYTKTLGSDRVGKHQAWLVPFDYTLTADDLKKFTFYKINMIANSPSPSVEATDAMWVFLTRLNAGDVLHANMPYVYKPLQAVSDYEFTTLNATLKTMNTDILLDTRTTEDIYSFYATYENTTATTADPFFYVGIDGNVSYGDNVTVGPLRWIIRKTSKFGSTPSYASKMFFYDVEETTSVSEELRMKSEESADTWYSLDGRCLNGKPTAAGLYIVGGRKVIVK